jgi:hypothetical protein
MLEAGVSFCQTAALREYPFEWRLAEVRDGIMHVSTVGLPDASYRKRSHIPEWRNDWVAGSPSDREFAIELRSPES